MVVFGVIGGSVAVSSQFLNEHHKSNCHAKYQYCNSLFGLVPALVLKVAHSPQPFQPWDGLMLIYFLLSLLHRIESFYKQGHRRYIILIKCLATDLSLRLELTSKASLQSSLNSIVCRF